MAKTNIIFNDKNYYIDESSLAAAIAELRSHLTTTMSGSGATITLDGIVYNVDSTKLTAAKNDFVSHLGTISGNGSKVVVGGVEYSVDSAKVSSALGDLETVLGGLNNPTTSGSIVEFDGDLTGKEYYDLGGDALLIKMTDELLTDDELIGSKLILVDKAEHINMVETEVTTEMIMTQPTTEDGGYMKAVLLDDYGACVCIFNREFNGIPAGTYFILFGYFYDNKLYVHGYTKSISCLTEGGSSEGGDSGYYIEDNEAGGQTFNITDVNAILSNVNNEFGGQTATVN